MRRKKLVSAAGVALALALVTGGAGATTFGVNPGGQGGAGGSTGGSPTNRMVAAVQTFRLITGNNNTITVARACSAVATPLPISTFVRCWLKAPNGTIVHDVTRGEALNAAVFAKTLNLPTQPYKMCVQGWALYRDGKTVYSGPPQCV